MSTDLETFITTSWNAGMSMQEIATELGVTRSVISGKVSRMREKGAQLATRARVATTPRKPRKRPQAPIIKVAYAPPPKTIPDISTILRFEKTKQVTMSKLTASSCRFIVAGSGVKAIYCGRQREAYSYCGEHHRLCYTPPTRRSSSQ